MHRYEDYVSICCSYVHIYLANIKDIYPLEILSYMELRLLVFEESFSG